MRLRRPAAVLLALAALGLAAAPGAATAEPSAAQPGTWALGWTGGVTLRVAPGRGWELDLAGGPRDYKSDEIRHVSQFDESGLIEYRVPDHETRESGWVRALLGRRLIERERLSLVLAAGAQHGWSDGQTRRYHYSVSRLEYRTTITDTYDQDWEAILVLRPRYRFLSWATAEFTFGFAYTWDRYELDQTTSDPGSERWEHTRVSQEGWRFATYGGWSGLGSLGLMFWF